MELYADFDSVARQDVSEYDVDGESRLGTGKRARQALAKIKDMEK